MDWSSRKNIVIFATVSVIYIAASSMIDKIGIEKTFEVIKESNYKTEQYIAMYTTNKNKFTKNILTEKPEIEFKNKEPITMLDTIDEGYVSFQADSMMKLNNSRNPFKLESFPKTDKYTDSREVLRSLSPRLGLPIIPIYTITYNDYKNIWIINEVDTDDMYLLNISKEDCLSGDKIEKTLGFKKTYDNPQVKTVQSGKLSLEFILDKELVTSVMNPLVPSEEFTGITTPSSAELELIPDAKRIEKEKYWGYTNINQYVTDPIWELANLALDKDLRYIK